PAASGPRAPRSPAASCTANTPAQSRRSSRIPDRARPFARASAAACPFRSASTAAAALRVRFPSRHPPFSGLLRALLLLPDVFEQPPRGVVSPRLRFALRGNEVRIFDRAAFEQRLLLLVGQHRRLSVAEGFRRERQDLLLGHPLELQAVRKARKHLLEPRPAARTQKFLQQPVAPRQDDPAAPAVFAPRQV